MIYLDHNATSPPTGEHLKKLFDILVTDHPANPSSPHALGRTASVFLASAHKQVASALGVDVGEIIFTSGGTESNNLGTRGIIDALEIKTPISIITTEFEHPSILKPLNYLKQKYKDCIELIFLKPNADGYIQIKDIITNIKPNTALVSIMAANNEIGTVQPVKEFGDFLNFIRWEYQESKRHKIQEKYPNYIQYFECLDPNVSKTNLQNLHFHVDAVQVFGKIQSSEWISRGYDSIALSGHKIGALQGVGALVLRRGRTFVPLNMGGAQEKNRRAGTENLPGIISFGLICELVQTKEYWNRVRKINELKDILFDEFSKKTNFVLNSQKHNALPNTVHFSVMAQEQLGENLIVKLDMKGIYVSSGSACSSGVNLPSHVILALGKSRSFAQNSIRISLGLNTTLEDIRKLLTLI